jgi:hypothetical protein
MAGMMDLDSPVPTDDRIIEVALFAPCTLFKQKNKNKKINVMMAKIAWFSS